LRKNFALSFKLQNNYAEERRIGLDERNTYVEFCWAECVSLNA
jgi:hypothetical protein